MTALRIKRRISRVAVVAITAAAASAHAGQATQTMAVSAQVSPSASFGLQLVARSLRVDASDVDRGYVDVVMKSRVANARGAELRPAVAMAIDPAAANGHSGNGHSKAAAGTLMRVVQESTEGASGELRYRFEFSREAREGRAGAMVSVAVDL